MIDSMKAPSALAPVAETLSVIARHYGFEAKLLEHRLQQRWPEIVSDQIAAHTWPDAIRFRKLYLLADNSVWLQQLMFLKPSLIEKINVAAGREIISDIVLRVGEVGGKAPPVHSKQLQGKREEATEQDPSQESRAEAATYAQALSDPELRTRFATIMARSLNSGRDRPKAE